MSYKSFGWTQASPACRRAVKTGRTLPLRHPHTYSMIDFVEFCAQQRARLSQKLGASVQRVHDAYEDGMAPAFETRR